MGRNKTYRDPITRCHLDPDKEIPTLHPYQLECVERLVAWSRAADSRSVTLCLPTGSGKTRTAVHFVLSQYVAARMPVLWLCHRTELVHQAVATFKELARVSPHGFRVGRFASKAEGRVGEQVAVVVAKIPTLSRAAAFEELVETQAPFRLVVVDECHHAVARTWQAVLERLVQRQPDLRILGLTATPTRTDKREVPELARLLGPSIEVTSPLRLMAEGYLAKLQVHGYGSGRSFRASDDDLRSARGDDELPKTLAREIAADDERTVGAVGYLLGDDRMRRWGKTLVFAQSKAQAERVRALISAASPGTEASAVFGDTPPDVREEIVRRFSSGDANRVLINVGVFTEGTDLKDVSTVFLLRATRSPILFAQMVGRGLRGGARNHGKALCNLVIVEDEIQLGSALATSYGWERRQLESLGVIQATIAKPIAEASRVSRRQVARPVDALVEKGLIHRLPDLETARILGHWEVYSARAIIGPWRVFR
jgi:superfamily II DNA or RNA helicase